MVISRLQCRNFRMFLLRLFLHAGFAGCISAVVLVRSWSSDTSALLSFRDRIATDSAFTAQRRSLTFHLAVTTDAAYPVNSLRNIALDQVSTSHVRVLLCRDSHSRSSPRRCSSSMLISSHPWVHVQLLLSVCAIFKASARFWLFPRLMSLVAARTCRVTSRISKTAELSQCSSRRASVRTKPRSTNDGGRHQTLLSSLLQNGTKRIFVTNRILSPLLASPNLTRGALIARCVPSLFARERFIHGSLDLLHMVGIKPRRHSQLGLMALSLKFSRPYSWCMLSTSTQNGVPSEFHFVLFGLRKLACNFAVNANTVTFSYNWTRAWLNIMFFRASMDSLHGTASTSLANWPRSDCHVRSQPSSSAADTAVVSVGTPPPRANHVVPQYGVKFEPFVLRSDNKILVQDGSSRDSSSTMLKVRLISHDLFF